MSRQKVRGPRPPSQRQLKVGEALRHAVAEILMRGELHDPLIDRVSLTISEARMSPDLRHATVFVAELGRDLSPEVRKMLKRVAPVIAGRVARMLHLKYAPVLDFVQDTSFREAARIDRLIAEARAEHPAEPTETGVVDARS